MGFLFRVLIGLGIATVGVCMVVRTVFFLDFFGSVAWAEEKFGWGGSNLFYKLLGIVIAVLGFSVMTNLWIKVLEGTLGQLFPQYR